MRLLSGQCTLPLSTIDEQLMRETSADSLLGSGGGRREWASPCQSTEIEKKEKDINKKKTKRKCSAVVSEVRATVYSCTSYNEAEKNKNSRQKNKTEK